MRLFGIGACVLMGLSGLTANGQTVGGQAASDAAPVMKDAKVFSLDDMKTRTMRNGAETHTLELGKLTTGEMVSLHETTLPVGSAPNPQHVIKHSELITVMQGTIAFERGDKSERVETGGVIYVAFGTMHTLRNVGDVPAKYVVVAIGGDVK